MKRAITIGLFLLPTLAACSSPNGEFPSLSRRPFESGAPIESPIVAPVPIASSLPDEIAGKVAKLRSQHATSLAAYNELLTKTRIIASSAAGSKTGSEAWVNAHVVVSRLDHARAGSPKALAEMDNLVAKRFDDEAKGAFPSIMPLLTPIQAEMAASVAAQNTEIQKLSVIIGL
jgi:hypothetical protein